MKNKVIKCLVILVFCLSFIPLNIAEARPGGGGRGGGGSRGGGGFSRSGGAGRVNSNVNVQNRGNMRDYSGNRTGNIGERQTGRTDRVNTRQDSSVNRQDNRTDRTDTRQTNRTDRTTDRQDNRTQRTDSRQDTRQDRIDNRGDIANDRWDNWYGGGWYGGGYYTPPGWGLAGLTTGLIIGSTINQAPPYYDTVYYGDTSYLYSDGVYLQPQGSSYVIVAPPLGAIVSYLPDGCNATVTNNVQYFECSGVIYQPYYQSGNVVYQVVRFNN
jgi:hypothetical protein